MNGRYRHLRAARAICFGIGCALTAFACDNTVDRSPNPAAAVDEVLGRAAGETIYRSDVEAPLALPLYDIEMQRFRLLRQSLEIAALERLQDRDAEARVAELSLPPPAPPRLAVDIDPSRVRPAGDAAVTILTFCNFESPHCVRLQRMLGDVLPMFGERVRRANRHFALPFHRNAGTAAEAARCAGEQDAYWNFHDRVLAGSGNLDRGRLDAAARGAGLDMDRYEGCLISRRHLPSIAADADAANRLAIDQVPAIFVNGLYAGNSADAAQLVWLIDSELERLGIESPRAAGAAEPTTASLLLSALLHSSHPGQGLAMLAPAAMPDRPGLFREGEAIGQNLVLRRVTSEGIEVVNEGRIEHLGLTGPEADAVSPAVEDEATRALIRPHRALPMMLDRDDVVVRLADRIGLSDALETVAMKTGDYHQLRISEVRPDSLYELLGLRAGDVILSVNEQPVHEASNPLWDALEREDEVRVRVMRRGGIAHHYTYRFE